MQVLAEHARAVSGLADVVWRVRRDQRGAVRLEEDWQDLVTKPRRMGTVLGRQPREQERDLGLLRITREADEGAGHVGFNARGVAQVRLAVGDLWEGEVAFRGCEAGHLCAELLDCAHTEAGLGFQAFDVFRVSDAAAVGETGHHSLIDGVVGVESVAEELEVPGELNDLVV